jgi:hypothetical protein
MAYILSTCTQDTDNIITVVVALVIVVLLIEELRD